MSELFFLFIITTSYFLGVILSQITIKKIIINMIWIIVLFCLFLILLLIFYPPISNNFPSWTEKASIIQTVFTVFGFFVALIGVSEYIKRIRKKIRPIILVEGKSNYLYKSDKYPLNISLTFFVKNDGELTILKDQVYYALFIPKELNITVKSGIKTESGTEIVPQKKNYQNDTNVHCLGGLIPSLVFPGRILRLYLASLEIKAPKTYIIKSYFSTESGFIPSNIKVDLNNEPIENLDEIKLEFI